MFGFANGDDEIVITLFRSKTKNPIEAIIEARTAAPKLIETSLKGQMNSELMEISAQALTMFNDFSSIAKFISKTIDETHSPHWHCVIGFKTHFHSENNHINFSNSSFIALEIQDLKILLFKS